MQDTDGSGTLPSAFFEDCLIIRKKCMQKRSYETMQKQITLPKIQELRAKHSQNKLSSKGVMLLISNKFPKLVWLHSLKILMNKVAFFIQNRNTSFSNDPYNQGL